MCITKPLKLHTSENGTFEAHTVIIATGASANYLGLPSEDAFKKLKGGNKELMIIPGANHTDLYDRTDKIPFDKIEAFFRANLQ